MCAGENDESFYVLLEGIFGEKTLFSHYAIDISYAYDMLPK